ncbi:MMPL family transporter [Paenibacillus sp. HB172176]|uniref:MMPL family transporter n=1 Tax=Paenibacillus sp. HB172176 TaxID=2493690 RepID=UPI001438AF91|nr:MMPL family transporter [Paenibacillus sp. HB172176]
MRVVLRMKWLMLVIWLAGAVLLMVNAPDMAELVRTKGQITVPDGYSSVTAAQLEKQIGANSGGGGLSTILVFHKEGGMGDADIAEVKESLGRLQQDSEALGIKSITSHFAVPDLTEQMVSGDGSTILALLSVDAGDREKSELRDDLYAELEDVSIDHYYTGDWLISEDVVESSEEGLKKTELITVGFILIILFIVFRSLAAPFVPLLAVGFSYLISQSIVAFLADQADFPLSNFTQIFMVAVLFGIGTDYCILLISRYKEELSHGASTTDAIVTTYRTAGRTVLFSGLAVFIGFASIGFSTFVLYRSAVAVAVGIVVLLLALFTLVPFFLSVLGKGLFWPAKKDSLEHKPNKLWGAAGNFSLKRPLWAIVVILIIIVPFLSAYKGSLSFNSLDEIGDKYNSVKGFNIIADSFGPGQTLPTNVIVKSGEGLATPEGLASIEKATEALLKVPGVQGVRSASRPTGVVMEQFLDGNKAYAVPQEVIDSEQFQATLTAYMSEDRTIAKFDVVFSSNPYAEETMNEIDSLEKAAKAAFEGGPAGSVEIAIGGVTATNHDLDTVSQKDYSHTVVWMLIGISLILIVLFRSIVIPLYVVLSLVITYFTSLAIAEVIFVRIVGITGISWSVPFFGFVLLMALGVDYSIFLMDRFKEYRELEPKAAILKSMKNMGAVIMSAAVILGGTFAAMMPAGVMSLLQIATVVLCGLALYSLVMLPLFIPVMVRLFGRANWWPFMRKSAGEARSSSSMGSE